MAKTIYYRDLTKRCGTLDVNVMDPPRDSCVKVRTRFCAIHCYVNKLERINRSTFAQRQQKLITVWNDPRSLEHALDAGFRHARNYNGLLRFASYGEALARSEWRDAIYSACERNADVAALAFTRAWRVLGDLYSRVLASAPRNLSIIASTDPSTTASEHAALRDAGARRSFFGDDENAPDESFVPCAKSWHHTTCAQCALCWDTESKANIHFKEH